MKVIKIFLGTLLVIVLAMYFAEVVERWVDDHNIRKANKRLREIEGEHIEMDALDLVEEAENSLRYRQEAKA